MPPVQEENGAEEQRISTALDRICVVLAATAALGCILRILSWALNLQPVPHYVACLVEFETSEAFCFLSLSLAALCTYLWHARGAAVLVRVLACLSIAIAIGCCQQSTSWLDICFAGFLRPSQLELSPVGALSPLMAIGGFLLAFSMFLQPTSRSPERWLEVLCYPVILASLLTLTAYAYGLQKLSEPILIDGGFHGLLKMSCVSALILLLLACGRVIFDRHSLTRLRLVHPTRGAMILRLLLPSLLGVPIIFGSINRTAVVIGLCDERTGESILITLLLSVAVLLVVKVADLLDAADRQTQINFHQREDLLYAVAHRVQVSLAGVERILALLTEQVDANLGKTLSLIRWNNFDVMLNLDNVLHEHRQELQADVEAESKFDLIELIDDCVAQMDIYAEAKDVSLFVQTQLAEANVNLQKEEIRKVLVNVLHNAIKFTEYGAINIAVFEKPAGIVVVSVQDTGTGIADEALASVFERTYQRESVGQLKASKGVGLHLSKRIIVANGGTIDCVSRLLKGTEVTISLPADQPAVMKERNYSTAGSTGGKRC